ncbi:MAG: hypothetical protein V7K32_19805 [Nostoc sp.]|uniref:hypothetical protein n=1 Tax=Nostoc sp. TaxID=1180 RepID=UPI002FFB6FE2
MGLVIPSEIVKKCSGSKVEYDKSYKTTAMPAAGRAIAQGVRFLSITKLAGTIF